MYHPKSIPAEVIKTFFTKNYTLGNIIEIKLIYVLGNAVWLVETDQQKYILKIFSQDNSIEKTKDEANLYTYLNAHHIKTPYVIASKDGALAKILDYNSTKYPVLIMKLEKLHKVTPEMITRLEVITIAKTIARMHNALLDYPNKQLVTEDRPPMLINYSHWDFYPKLATSPNGKDVPSSQLEQLKNLGQKLETYLHTYFPPSDIQLYSIIHSDIALDHAQFLPTGEVYLFDFTDRVWGPMIYELAVFMCHIYREGGITFERWEEIKTWLFEGYQSVTKFSHSDLTALTPLIIRRIQGEIAYINDMSIEFGQEVDNEGQKNRYKLLEYLLK